MERVAFRIRLRPGMQDEYKKRHDNLWPEMTEVLNEAGIHNYTIWNVENDLFGYYETSDSAYSNSVLANSAVVDRWNRYMEAVIVFDIDSKTGTLPEMKLVFYHK